MKKRMKAALALALALVLILLCVPGSVCAENTKQYRVAGADVLVTLPQNWYYGDRSITDDNPFCLWAEKTAAEFISSYLSDNVYLVAFDVSSASMLTLDVEPSDAGDYMNLGEDKIREASEELSSWMKENGYTILSEDVVRLNRPYYRLITRDSEYTVFNYVTVLGGKKYLFYFMNENEDYAAWGTFYGEIVRKAAFPTAEY